MSELQKYIIYKIVCILPDIEYCYVGSCKQFARRLYKHKRDAISNNSKIYKIIRQHGGFDNFKMEEIESIECDGSLDARVREQYYIETLNANLNTNRAYTSEEDKKQYYSNHKIEIKQKYNPEVKRLYYLQNKEKRIAYAKAYYKRHLINETSKVLKSS